jgi:hypothetical protein
MSTISNTTGDALPPGTAENAPKQVSSPDAQQGTATSFFGSIVREPLIHFLVIGTLIFGIDYALHPPAKDEKVILVTKALRQSFIENFDEDKERVPTEDELNKMTDAWVASEILYREGKALGVDRGDSTIRDRIAFKLQVLIFSQVQVERPTEPQLREWFAKNHERFDKPETVGFYFTTPTDEATARRELAEIESQSEGSDVQSRTRAVLGRPVASLAPAFGEGFRDALLASPIGQWTVLQSKDGWHVVRLDARRPGEAARFEDFVEQVDQNWRTDQSRIQAWEAVNRLKTSYRIEHEK